MKEEIKLKRLERIKIAIEKGITCNPETGEVFGVRGNLLTNRDKQGYVIIYIVNKGMKYNIRAHQFIWFVSNNQQDDYFMSDKVIDHINNDRSDNRISNLRVVTQQKNMFNQPKARGFHLKKDCNKFESYIKVNQKKIYLGLYETEKEAHQAYLDAKKIYHKI